MKRKSSKDEHYYTEQPKSKAQLGLIRTHLRGRFFEFLTSSSVFSKKRVDLGTRLLIESMVLPEKGCVLDLGCGYGPVGIAAAVFNSNLHVVMVDVNERAVWLTRENAKRDNVDNVEVRHGFLYEPVEKMKFNVILCNPPVSAGMQIVLPIVTGAPEHLEEDGLFQIVVRSKIGGKRVLNELEKTFGNVEVLARKSGYRLLLSKKS
ncbi:MAG: class I SAM-dependent methyltransferase [Candidatus Bathyarchaeota archaeon]|nr:class I SAM-dependent methyltransferase [Candidatus Bathyarchaeota archaeon]MDH5494825.1 class I SAM-dependent methyltransferase [Candidatus Bathyarchaeota archaeon]